MLLGHVDFPVCHLNHQSEQISIQELRLLGDVSRDIEAYDRHADSRMLQHTLPTSYL